MSPKPVAGKAVWSRTACESLARVKTYTPTKNSTCTFTGSHLRAVTNADDDDNA